MTTRVLIADDHPIVRQGMVTLLRSLTGFAVVGEAVNGREAVALAEQTRPDVVVMDLNMPELDGIEATRRIVAQFPEVGVLVLTMFEDDDSLFAALRAGARGYILKGAPQVDVERALISCARGDAIFGPAIAARVLDLFAAGSQRRRTPFPELTAREHEVLHLIARGIDNTAIAIRLGMSAKTVRNHASNIFTKLHVSSRAEAIVRAREAGIGGAGQA